MKASLIEGAILGHIIGDALGVPVEFCPREKLQSKPVDKMLSYGTHSMPIGTWSDDSSMMLCTLSSINEKNTLDFDDIMARFSRWAKEGYMTPYGKPFGVGRTTLKALGNFWRGKAAVNCGCVSEKDNGNGSLMRILPIALYNAFILGNTSAEEKIQNIHKGSSLTHAHNRTCMACGIYYFVLEELTKRQDVISVWNGLKKAQDYYKNDNEYLAFKRLFSSDFADLPKSEISSSGYVVDTLEAAIWCLLNSHSYKETVLQAVNLGGDTDTIAAVSGGLAGVLYGNDGLPKEWLDVIIDRENILLMCCNLERLIFTHSRKNQVEQ